MHETEKIRWPTKLTKLAATVKNYNRPCSKRPKRQNWRSTRKLGKEIICYANKQLKACKTRCSWRITGNSRDNSERPPNSSSMPKI